MDLCEKWTSWNSKGCPDPTPFTVDDLKLFSAGQIQEFLAELLDAPPLSAVAIEMMANLYNLKPVHNAEIKLTWLRLCLRAKIKEAIPVAIGNDIFRFSSYESANIHLFLNLQSSQLRWVV